MSVNLWRAIANVLLLTEWHCPFLCKALWAYLWPRYSIFQPHCCSTIKYIQVRTLLNNSSKDEQINLNSLWIKARHLDVLCKSIVSVFITKIQYCQPHYCSTIKYIQVKNTLNNSNKDDQIHLNSLWIKEFAMALDCNTSGWCNNCSLPTGIKIQESHRNLYSATTGSPTN